MLRLSSLVVLLLPALLAPGALGAQEFRYLAFGDSITDGNPVFDEENKGGYPGRLAVSLGCSPGVCSVDNQGLGGETTGGGVSRLSGVINSGDYDVMLLMEGTNDIFNSISNSTIKFNLEIMGDIATGAGVDTVIASIIWFHPNACVTFNPDPVVEDLKNKIISIAGSNGYYFANPWLELCPSSACFDTHYYSPAGCGGFPPFDPVGHPDASGFDILSDVWLDAINSVPVPGSPTPVSPGGVGHQSPAKYTFDRESPVRATWYEVEIDGPGGTLHDEWYQASEICDATSCTAVEQLNLPAGTYSWRVRGRNPQGRSAWSAPLVFTIEPPAGGPTLTLLSGSCAAGPQAAGAFRADVSGGPGPGLPTLRGEGFPPNFKAAIVMAAGNNGFVKGGPVCNGAIFEISPPLVLPPTWAKADASGTFTVKISGEQCFVQALAIKSCEVSNLVVLP